MKAKTEEKRKAISYREKGYSYSEILKQVNVSQASLSSWLKDIKIAELLVKKLADKKEAGQKKGALTRKTMRINHEAEVIRSSSREISDVTQDSLLMMGAIAYWCEGSKQKTHNVSQPVVFSNSDPILIKLFLKWVKEICFIEEKDLIYNLCIHESGDEKKALKFWSISLSIPVSTFSKTVFKKHNIKTTRKNINFEYNGLLRITVRRSADLNRKIAGWVLGINKFL